MGNDAPDLACYGCRIIGIQYYYRYWTMAKNYLEYLSILYWNYPPTINTLYFIQGAIHSNTRTCINAKWTNYLLDNYFWNTIWITNMERNSKLTKLSNRTLTGSTDYRYYLHCCMLRPIIHEPELLR